MHVAAILAVLALVPLPASAQTEVDVAMKFFGKGGAYCFRVVPEGTNLSDEHEWTFMVLTSESNRRKEFRTRSMDPGTTGMRGKDLELVGLAITTIWRRESLLHDFFDRFSSGIGGRVMSARVVRVRPPGLAAMTARERAEAYLKFSERGRLRFDDAEDLTPEGFMVYRSYLPD
jgi:hypothetical protein